MFESTICVILIIMTFMFVITTILIGGGLLAIIHNKCYDYLKFPTKDHSFLYFTNLGKFDIITLVNIALNTAVVRGII